MDHLPDNLPIPCWVLMTPERAGEIMLLNTHNRPRNESRTGKIIEDMRHDRWDPYSCVQIIIADDGTLLNGQKTLTGIVRTGIAQPVILIEGVPATAWLAMDNVQPRTLGQELARDGVTNPNLCAATVKGLWQYERLIPIGERKGPSTTEGRLRWREIDTLAQERVVDVRRINEGKDGLRFSSASAMATVWLILDEIDPDGGERFFYDLAHGAYAPRDRHPIRQLRRHIETVNKFRAHQGRHGGDNVIDAAWLILACNAYRTADHKSISYRERNGKLPKFPRLLSAEQVAEVMGDVEAIEALD